MAQVSTHIDAWLAMAGQHVGTAEVTALPSRHALEATLAEVEQALAGLAVLLGPALGWFALKSLHRQLGAESTEVARPANAVAGGDLTLRIDTDGVPQARVVAAIARLQHSLQATVSRVLDISGPLATGSQQNAGLAEQSAAAAESLQRQGRQVVEAMAFFKLDRGRATA